MKIKGTDLTLSTHGDSFWLKSDSGLAVSFTHYNDLKITGHTEKSFFVGYKMVAGDLIRVCEIQGKNAVVVYEAISNYNVR